MSIQVLRLRCDKICFCGLLIKVPLITKRLRRTGVLADPGFDAAVAGVVDSESRMTIFFNYAEGEVLTCS